MSTSTWIIILYEYLWCWFAYRLVFLCVKLFHQLDFRGCHRPYKLTQHSLHVCACGSACVSRLFWVILPPDVVLNASQMARRQQRQVAPCGVRSPHMKTLGLFLTLHHACWFYLHSSHHFPQFVTPCKSRMFFIEMASWVSTHDPLSLPPSFASFHLSSIHPFCLFSFQCYGSSGRSRLHVSIAQMAGCI